MRRRLEGRWLAVAVALVAVALVVGCAGKGKKESEIWMFSMPEGRTLTYNKTEDADQEMEIMGQAMEVSYNRKMEFTMAPVKIEGMNITSEVTINSLEASMSSPQGDFEADGTPAIGKSFMMTFSTLGKEIDMSGAEEVKYSQGPQGERSVMPDFAGFLPDLPGTPVKVGDTWNSTDEIPVNDETSELLLKLDNLNTLMGFETLDGMKCARVEAVVTGTLTGTGQQMGAPLTFEGTMEGTETWYFAVEKGIFVKSNSDMATSATVTVKGPQEMVIPLTMNVATETALIK